ncbi:MAG: nucleotide pyrophosphohydrolase [Candidatus Bathyarchaeota archaeon]|nr:MAG: nucleotide pyrophosphohydrolase [Candidatus Bathyarchaeota archaeon]
MEVREFQNMMRRIYFRRDSARGAAGTFNWLRDEVEDLEAAIDAEDKKALEDEFADVLAWLASLANVVEIDLEGATMKKYDGKCPKCDRTPCNCTT